MVPVSVDCFREELGLTLIRFPTKGILSSDGKQWKHSRNMLRPNFNRSQIDDTDNLKSHVDRLLAQIPGDGTLVNLSELFFCLTLDTATEFLFGESTNTLSQATKGHEFADAFARSQVEAFRRAVFGPVYRMFSDQRSAKKDCEYIHEFAEKYIQSKLAKQAKSKEERASGEKERYVFLDELIRQTDDRAHIRSELINILLAGRDTTASLLTNVWFILGQRRDIWQNLQREISGFLGCKEPSSRELKHL